MLNSKNGIYTAGLWGNDLAETAYLKQQVIDPKITFSNFFVRFAIMSFCCRQIDDRRDFCNFICREPSKAGMLPN